MLCGDLNGQEFLKRGDILTSISDSLYCTAGNNTLESNFTPVKLKKKRDKQQGFIV